MYGGFGKLISKDKDNRLKNHNNKYCNIKKKYLADALSFLGFRYYKFNYCDDTIYSFENTEKFQKALTGLLQLRKQINH